MKKISATELLANEWPMSLARNPNDDGAFEASCPCGQIHGENFEVVFHCWRAGCGQSCGFSGIHVSGALDTATKQKLSVRFYWHNSQYPQPSHKLSGME